jgi:hypothetical protein
VDNSANPGAEDGFLIQRDSGSGFANLTTVGRDVRSYSDTGLTTGKLYRYRVQAFNITGTSGFTNIAETAPSSNPLVPPTNLTVEVLSSTSARLRWLDNSNNETRFEVTRWDGADRTYRTFVAGGPNTTTYLDTNLSPNSRYIYYVVAWGPSGGLGTTNQVEIHTPN